MQVTIQINKKIGPHPPGTTLGVDADLNGTPLDEFWRRRLKDAKTDDCCEILKPKAKAKAAKPKTGSESS